MASSRDSVPHVSGLFWGDGGEADLPHPGEWVWGSGSFPSFRCVLDFDRGADYSGLDPRGGVRMFGLGMPELLVILVIILVIFGAGKLPEIGAGLGKGIRNFRRATKGENEIDVTPQDKRVGGEKSEK